MLTRTLLLLVSGFVLNSCVVETVEPTAQEAMLLHASEEVDEMN